MTTSTGNVARTLFLTILVLATVLRLGYGIAKHRESFSKTGDEFILLWDHDAAEHVLMAQSLLRDGSYRVPPPVPLGPFEGKTIRFSTFDALYKAPLYGYFLAGVFAISGFNFFLFFPLQAVLAGCACGFMALIAFELFGSWRTGAVAGVLAAGHPVLLNSSSLPYNESLFVALLFGSVWAFLQWLRAPRVSWAIGAGVLSGLAILCRESAAPLLLTMAAFALVVRPSGLRPAVGAAVVMVGVATLIVLPWTLRTYVRTGQVVPVAAVTGTVLAEGSNECLAAEPLLSWYWAEGSCGPLQLAFLQRLVRYPSPQWDDTLLYARLKMTLGRDWITTHPREYLALSARRAATLLLPFHPRQQLGRMRQALMTIYWLLVVPLGLAGIVLSLRRLRSRVILLLPILLIGAIVLPQILIYFSPDMRYRLPADMLLACFAAHLVVERLGLVLDRRDWMRRRMPGGAPAVV